MVTELGARYLFVVSPDKETVYPDSSPRHPRRGR